MIQILLFLLCYQQIDCKTIYATATFGRQGENCAGRGICSFREAQGSTTCNVQLFYNTKEALFEVKIFKNKISENEVKQQIGFDEAIGKITDQKGFLMEDSLTIPESICLKLGMSRLTNVIQPAHYNMIVNEDYFIVQFKMCTP